MIMHGKLQSERPDLNGKPYTLDFDRDFLHLTMVSRPVAFSDYFPVPRVPNEYIIIDFDKDGRVVGFAFEGILTRWSEQSLKNRIRFALTRMGMNAKSVSFASRIVSEAAKQFISSAVPKTDQNGRLPAYSY